MSTEELLLVTGATGKTGLPAVQTLCAQGAHVRALVHTHDERSDRLAALGAEVVEGDLLDFNSMSAALAGITNAYFCYPIHPGRLLEATSIFAQAASEAGVRAVVNMSQISAHRDAKSHAARDHWIAERLLDRTAMMTTHLRPTFFATWLAWTWNPGKAGWTRRDGEAVLRLPFADGRHAPIEESDQGRVIAAVLANPAPHDGQTYQLTGPVEMNHHEIATELSAALGLSVRYEPIEIEAFVEALIAAGWPPFLVQHLSNVAQDYQNGVFSGANNLVEVITGKPATSVAEYATVNRAAFDVTVDANSLAGSRVVAG